MRVMFLSMFLAAICMVAFMPKRVCEAAESDKGEELFNLSDTQPNSPVFEIGDTVLLPDGKNDVIVEVLRDGRMKTMEDVIISEKGEVLEGVEKRGLVRVNKESPTIVITPVTDEKVADIDIKEQRKVQKELARMMASYLEAEKMEKKREEKTAKAGEEVVEAQKERTIEDLLAFEGEEERQTPVAPREQKGKPKQNKEKSKSAAGGKNLRIPKGAAKKNDLSFMAGCWTRKVHDPNGQRIDRECLCLNKKGRTGQAYYIVNSVGGLLCRATVDVRLLSDNQLVYSTKRSICSKNGQTITGVPVHCTQGSRELMCAWSVSGGKIGTKYFKYPFTRVNSCPR